MGTPHYGDSVTKLFHRPLMCSRAESQIRNRIKHMMGYPEASLEAMRQEDKNVNHHDGDEFYNVLLELEHYGLGNVRSRNDYLRFAEIDLDEKTCGPMKWCSEGELE
jgi:hypothetical protein